MTVDAVEVVSSQMPAEFQNAAVETARVAVEAAFAEKTLDLKRIACEIKQSYDKKYPGNGKATDGVYHCIVGSHFACAASHEFRQHIWMRYRQLNIVLWKSKDCPFHFNDA